MQFTSAASIAPPLKWWMGKRGLDTNMVEVGNFSR